MIRLEKAIWMFPFALALHNAEEAVWMPAWSQRAGFWMAPIGTAEFRIAAALLAAIGFFVTSWAQRSGAQSLGIYVLAGFAFAMMLNVVYHMAATVGLLEYAPGVITAVLLNLPATSYLLLRFFRERWIAWPKVLVAFVIVPLGIVLLIPVLFWIGNCPEHS